MKKALEEIDPCSVEKRLEKGESAGHITFSSETQ
jgi:hypothetical protein